MRQFLLALIIVMIGAYDVFVVFLAWFTVGFFGFGWSAILIAVVFVATGVAATVYGIDRWRKVWRGQSVRV